MARKPSAYRRRPRRVTSRPIDKGDINEAAAQELAAGRTLDELRTLADEAEDAHDLADQEARDQPGPDALRRYQQATRALGEVRRALEIKEN
ncbi:MAG: hypothetical protein EXR51_10945 [Dehalococcoidia bacterium]|nr:hypothetical protein [Dehalococcoidia bacterium]